MGQLGTGLAGELGFKRQDNPLEYGRAWNARHRDELNAYHRDYYHNKIKTDPKKYTAKLEYSSVARRKKKYGITREGYKALLAEQEGRCYICHTSVGNELRVDHDHKTGKVRKLLCSNCNSAIGLMQEDGTRLHAAADYLEQHNS